MFKKYFYGTAVLLAVFFAEPFVCAQEPVMKTLAAHVVSVPADGSNVTVDFRHPAKKKVYRIIFYKDGQTGLSGIGSLKDLRVGQVVSIDYVVGAKKQFLIRRIAKVKLSGPPPGLENFDGI